MSTRKGTFWAFKRSRFQVDHLAYKWLLEIALKVLPSQYDDERREEFITDIFEQVCADGWLSSTFLNTITSGPFYDEGWTKVESERLYKKLMGDPPFPTSWSRNLKDESKWPSTNEIHAPNDNP